MRLASVASLAVIRRNFDHLTFSKPLKLSEYVDQFVVFDSFNIKIEWKSICVSFLMELAKTFARMYYQNFQTN